MLHIKSERHYIYVALELEQHFAFSPFLTFMKIMAGSAASLPSHELWPLQQILVTFLSAGKALDVPAYLSDLNTAT